MPSLMRFLTLVCLVGAVGFGAVYALATFVKPRTREMVVTIPAARLKAPSATAEAASPRTAVTQAPEAAATPGASTQ